MEIQAQLQTSLGASSEEVKQDQSHSSALNLQSQEFKPSFTSTNSSIQAQTHFSVNAQEFIPSEKHVSSQVQNQNQQNTGISMAANQAQINQKMQAITAEDLRVKELISLMDSMLKINGVKESQYLIHAIDKEALTIRFETLFQEPRIQLFFMNLRTDLVTQQIIMSHALRKFAKADFQKQLAKIKPCDLLAISISSTKDLTQEKIQELLEQSQIQNSVSIEKKYQDNFIVKFSNETSTTLALQALQSKLAQSHPDITIDREIHQYSYDQLKSLVQNAQSTSKPWGALGVSGGGRQGQATKYRPKNSIDEASQEQRTRLFSEQIPSTTNVGSKDVGYSKKFLKYNTDQVLSIFQNLNLPETINDEFKNKFSEELVRNVFRDSKRTELCLNEADQSQLTLISMSKSERGVSIDETNLDPEAIMRLKKTTVLTGNHAVKNQQRDRARSDNDFMHNMFKNELASHLAANTSPSQDNNGSSNVNHDSENNQSSADKKYAPKVHGSQQIDSHLQVKGNGDQFVAYRKKSHAVQ